MSKQLWTDRIAVCVRETSRGSVVRLLRWTLRVLSGSFCWCIAIVGSSAMDDKKWDVIFGILDRNRDAVLSLDEVLKPRTRRPLPINQENFDEFDQNGDGVLSREEVFLMGSSVDRRANEENFRKWDLNNDGFVDRDERYPRRDSNLSLRGGRGCLRGSFEWLDSNEDGGISLEECLSRGGSTDPWLRIRGPAGRVTVCSTRESMNLVGTVVNLPVLSEIRFIEERDENQRRVVRVAHVNEVDLTGIVNVFPTVARASVSRDTCTKETHLHGFSKYLSGGRLTLGFDARVRLFKCIWGWQLPVKLQKTVHVQTVIAPKQSTDKSGRVIPMLVWDSSVDDGEGVPNWIRNVVGVATFNIGSKLILDNYRAEIGDVKSRLPRGEVDTERALGEAKRETDHPGGPFVFRNSAIVYELDRVLWRIEYHQEKPLLGAATALEVASQLRRTPTLRCSKWK